MGALARRALVALALLSLVPDEANASIADPKFSEAPFAKLETYLTGLAWAPDASDRLFLIRQNGQVRIVEDGNVLATPFAMLSPLYQEVECGLLGIAFDPAYIENRYVYFYVTVSSTEQQIVRYTDADNVGTDKTTIVAGLPAAGPYHCGGGIGFGPDGKLYWSTGDLGIPVGVDDDLSSLAAKIGRSNRDGSVPADNPFFDGDGPNNDLIWARGFRSPFSLTREPSTERLWVNVAGTQYEQVFAPVAGDHTGWNDYENNQPAGYLSPVIAYRTGAADVRTITAAVRAGGVSTFTTSVAHRFRPGTKLTIAGVANPSFNGSAFVSDVPSETEFAIAQAGADASSSGGSATTLSIGNAITGGTFWDSSGVPGDYRGNFFFGDYVSGNLVRATVGPASSVTSVDLWGSYLLPTDMDIGPDGNLYYVSYGNAANGGTVARASYGFSSQALVVSRLHLRGLEGASLAFAVRLALAPTGAVAVSVAQSAGDVDVSVAAGASLSFDAASWSEPQIVTLAAAEDPDATDDEATIAVSSPGLETEHVVVRVTDEDPLAIVSSATSIELDEGGTASFDVSLSGPIDGAVSVSVTASGDPDVALTSGAVSSFDPSSWSTPETVTLSAAHDDDLGDDTATLTLTSDGLPTLQIAVTVRDDDAAPSDGGAGAAGDGGASGGAAGAGDDDGCGCTTTNRAPSAWLVLGVLALLRRWKKREPPREHRSSKGLGCD